MKSFLTGLACILILCLSAEESTPLEYGIENWARCFQKRDCCRFADHVHGFFDVAFKNKYVTPRGLLVSNKDLVTQFFTGVIFDVYRNPTCFLDEASFVIGAWNDLSRQQNNPTVGSWNELDWFVGLNLSICKNWKLNTEYIEFLSPPNFFREERNLSFTLLYDDKCWGFPITFHPYAKLFYAISGDSTVVVGKPGGTYYTEFGLLPVFAFDVCGEQMVLAAPTWLSVGPSSFWNGGVFGLKNETSNFGVFSTGLRGSCLIQFIPKYLGKWTINVGAQYYYLINDNLLEAQMFQLVGEWIDSFHRNIGVISSGITLYF